MKSPAYGPARVSRQEDKDNIKLMRKGEGEIEKKKSRMRVMEERGGQGVGTIPFRGSGVGASPTSLLGDPTSFISLPATHGVKHWATQRGSKGREW